MAKYTNDELLEAFGEMTLVELSEFVKAFEEKFASRLPLRLPLLPLLLALLLRLRKRRMSSTSSSPPSATRRSRSSRLSAPSPTSAWPRPRLLSTALRRPSSRRPRRKMPRRPRLSWKRLAPASSSSDLCGISRNHSFSRNPAPVFQAAGFRILSRLVDEDEAENAIRRGNTKLAMSESCQFCAQ